MKTALVAVAVTIFTCSAVHAETLVEQLLAAYDTVETVTCEVRKETETEKVKTKLLSRIFYQKPDKIHIENIMPALGSGKRRILADGETLYIHEQGKAKGYSKPIAELDRAKLIELRKLPGTPMDHLLRLQGVDEEDLPSTAEFPSRKAYQTDLIYVVLSLDEEARLTQIDFYKSSAMEEQISQYTYSAFSEPVPGAVFSGLQKSAFKDKGFTLVETVRISNLAVNESVSPMLFVPGAFFEDVEFVPDLGPE